MREKFISELLGTAFLVIVVLGSGTAADQMFPGNAGLALLTNSIATGCGLFAIIQCLGPISGAHLNPVISVVETLWGRLDKKTLGYYVSAQMFGAYFGILAVHVLFKEEIFQLGITDRAGYNNYLSEIIATFGLISVVALAGRKHVEFAPFSAAAYITSAYWFTASTSFVNPAVTLARIFTNTFGGMAPQNYLPYIASQFTGAILAYLLLKGLDAKRGPV